MSGSSYTWFIFNLNTNQCYSQIIHNDTHMHRYMYITTIILYQPTPLLPFLARPWLAPFVWLNPSFYLLGDPASFACGGNTHPLLSLVCYQLFSLCCCTHPKAPQSSYIFTKTTSTTSAVPSDTVNQVAVCWKQRIKIPNFSILNYFVVLNYFYIGRPRRGHVEAWAKTLPIAVWKILFF